MRKKLLALVLAGTMLLTGVVPAFASEQGDAGLPALQVEEIGISDETSLVGADEKAMDSSLTEALAEEEAEDGSAEDFAGATKWARKITLTIKKAGNYGVSVTGCAGQIVSGQILSGKEIVALGNTEKTTEDRFGMKGYFKKGTYTLCLSNANAKYTLMRTDAMSGKCGKNVSFQLKKTGTKKIDGNTYNFYTLTLSGKGATYNYPNTNYYVGSWGYGTKDGCLTPWVDALQEEREIIAKDGDSIRYNRDVLKEIRVEDGITKLGDNLFAYISSYWAQDMLTDVSLPASLKKIGRNVFRDAHLKTLTIPDNVVSVGKGTLSGLSVSTLKIGENASIPVKERVGADKVVVSSKNPYVKSVKGSLFTKNGKRLIKHCYIGEGKEDYEYTVPNGTEIISSCAFLGYYRYKKITLPKTVKELEQGAFSGIRVNEIVILGNLKKVNSSYLTETNDYRLPTFIFYGDAPSGQLVGDHFFYAKVFYPAGNKTWTKSLRNKWTEEREATNGMPPYSTIQMFSWTPGKTGTNTIKASDITVKAKKSKQEIDLKAEAKFGNLSYKSNNSKVVTDYSYDLYKEVLMVPAGFKGTVVITITSDGNTAYKSATKKIKVTVK